MWDGAVNLRDVGGLPLVSGGTTRPGRLFRSGSTDAITPAGWAQARAAGVTTVVDLRNEVELDAHQRPPDITRVSTPTEAPQDVEFVRVCGPWLDHPRYYSDNLRLFPELIGAALAAVANAGTPILLHCAAGRDRTGMVVSLILRLNDVDPEAIADDYVRGAEGFNHVVTTRGGTKLDEAELAAWVAPRRVALLAWLDVVDGNVGPRLGLSAVQEERLSHLLH